MKPSDNDTFSETKYAVSTLKLGKSVDPTCLVQEVFKTSVHNLTILSADMGNDVIKSKIIPKD